MALIDLLKFATSGPWGPSTNDRRLTAPEADGNIYNLEQAIQYLIDNPVEGVSVSEISVSGRQVTFHMSDASTHGPFDLPIAQPRYRGEWVTATAYSTFDIITVTLSGTYMVLQDHTSEATFDEDASNSDGAYYVKIGAVVEGGGGGGSFGEFTFVAGGPCTVIEAWAGNLICSQDGNEFLLPEVLSNDGLEFRFRQCGATVMTFITEGSMVIRIKATESAGTTIEGDVVYAKYSEGDGWYLWGDLAAAP